MARKFVEVWGQTAGYSDLERGAILMAVDEAVTNIMRHTYNSSADFTIELSAEITKEQLRFSLRDYGPTVNFAQMKGRELEDIKPGGLGLLLIQGQFPTFEHTPMADGNLWLLGRPLPPVPQLPHYDLHHRDHHEGKSV